MTCAPRPFTIAGLLICAAGTVSTVTLLSLGFGFLLPIVRFGGLLWLIAAAVLPRTRHGRPA